MFNTQQYNGISTIIPPVITPDTGAGSISIGSSTPWYFDIGVHTVTGLRYLRGKSIEYTATQIGSGGVYYNFKQGENGIEVEWYIKWATRYHVLQQVDTIKANLIGQKKYLKISDSGLVRRCLAVLKNEPEFSEDRTDINIQKFKLLFSTFDYMEDDTPESMSATFTAPYSFNIARSWSADAKVSITLNFTSATSVTSLVVNIAGVLLTVTTPITAPCVILIDGEKKTITKNGSAVSFLWEIPKLKSANNTVTITPNGTYSVDMIAQYRPAHK